MAPIAEELPDVVVASAPEDVKRQIAQAALDALAPFYHIVQPSAASDFFVEHFDVPRYLALLVPELHRCFGETTEFRLRFSGGDFGYDVLYAVVMWPGELDAVRSALDQFDEWWSKHPDSAQQLVCVTYELV